MAPTYAGGDEEEIEDKLVGLASCGHYDIDLVGAVFQLRCLEVGGYSRGGVNDWLLGSGCNAELGRRLREQRLSGDLPEKPSILYSAIG